MVFRYFITLFLLSFLLVARLFWPFLSILVLSLLLTGIFRPIYTFLLKKFSPTLASLATCQLIIFVVFVPLIFFIGALSKEAFELYQLYQLGLGAKLNLKLTAFIQESAAIASLQELLAGFDIVLEPEGMIKTLSNFAKAAVYYLFTQASGWAANIMGFVLSFFMMIITIFFLLIDSDKLTDYLIRLSPLPDEQERKLFAKFREIAGAVLLGNGVCGLIQGVFGGLAFIFFGLGSPILWGGMMAILAFLPIFGISLILVPASLVLLLQGRIGHAITMLVYYLVLSFSVEYLLKPKMVGEQIKMHTLLVFLSILGGLSVFGFLGIIYGPLIVTGFLTMADIYLAEYDSLVKES